LVSLIHGVTEVRLFEADDSYVGIIGAGDVAQAVLEEFQAADRRKVSQQFTDFISEHYITQMDIKPCALGLSGLFGIHTTSHDQMMLGINWVVKERADGHIVHRVFLLKHS